MCKVHAIIWVSSQPCFSLFVFHLKKTAGQKLDALEPLPTKGVRLGLLQKLEGGCPVRNFKQLHNPLKFKDPFVFSGIEGPWIFEIFALVLPQTNFVFTFTFHWHPGRGPTPKLSPFLIIYKVPTNHHSWLFGISSTNSTWSGVDE